MLMVVYIAQRLDNVARGQVQIACTSLNVFFPSMGLTKSGSMPEVMLFPRKHEPPPILVRIGSYVYGQHVSNTNIWVYFSILGCDGAAM
jgi:hypothetical protein